MRHFRHWYFGRLAIHWGYKPRQGRYGSYDAKNLSIHIVWEPRGR